jgi:thiamine-phosphate pyrophosphorylase
MRDRLQGLYAITDDRRSGPEALCDAVEAALSGGARIVQYRDKGSDPSRRLAEARALAHLCQALGAVFMVNDDVDLAVAVMADGVHLGRHDQDIGTARSRMPAGCIIGVSCYDSLDMARRAAAEGADYVAFGSFFPSPTKPGAVRAGPELLERARRALSLPTVAIGGISPENGAALVRAGADMLAVISGVFAAPDVTAAARAYSNCFRTAEESHS